MSMVVVDQELISMGPSLYEWLERNPAAYVAASVVATQILSELAETCGQRVHALTAGRISLNAIPQPIREACRDIGISIENRFFHPTTDRLMRWEEQHPRFQQRGYIYAEGVRTLLLAPIVEELLLRLPTIVAFQLIDAVAGSSVAGRVAKIGVTILSATLFTYMHAEDPQSGRAASLFTSGVCSVYLANTFGLLTSIGEHFLHNARLLFCGRRRGP